MEEEEDWYGMYMYMGKKNVFFELWPTNDCFIVYHVLSL